MAGRVPLENVSEKKNKMDARGPDDGYSSSKFTDCQKWTSREKFRDNA
jgi:hypothetical protein